MTTGTASALSGTINFGEVLPTSSAGTAMASLSSAMQSAEHQLMLLQQKQQQLLKLQQQKHKLEQQLADHVTHVGPKHKVIKVNLQTVCVIFVIIAHLFFYNCSSLGRSNGEKIMVLTCRQMA